MIFTRGLVYQHTDSLCDWENYSYYVAFIIVNFKPIKLFILRNQKPMITYSI